MNHTFSYQTRIGVIRITETGGAITRIDFGEAEVKDDDAACKTVETPLLAEAAKQLTGYFAGRRKTFELPLAPRGTSFQQAVWAALQLIPYGETRSYLEIARAIDRPTACRAVGMANHNNPIAIVIPCHRVIGYNGKLVGYGGGLDIKKKLLDLEKTNSI